MDYAFAVAGDGQPTKIDTARQVSVCKREVLNPLTAVVQDRASSKTFNQLYPANALFHSSTNFRMHFFTQIDLISLPIRRRPGPTGGSIAIDAIAGDIANVGLPRRDGNTLAIGQTDGDDDACRTGSTTTFD